MIETLRDRFVFLFQIPTAITLVGDYMPVIRFDDIVIECKEGENLRRVLLRARAPLYNGASRLIHCRGIGTCGTCSLKIEGPVTEMTAVEKWRLSFPPHRSESGLRLACQCRVLGDLQLTKFAGMWGHRTDSSDDDTPS
ncbi:MAG: 2Fe-2S iron-sulfur cluster binding domain-containing protein [Planctomycetota bacterium]